MTREKPTKDEIRSWVSDLKKEIDKLADIVKRAPELSKIKEEVRIIGDKAHQLKGEIGLYFKKKT